MKKLLIKLGLKLLYPLLDEMEKTVRKELERIKSEHVHIMCQRQNVEELHNEIINYLNYIETYLSIEKTK